VQALAGPVVPELPLLPAAADQPRPADLAAAGGDAGGSRVSPTSGPAAVQRVVVPPVATEPAAPTAWAEAAWPAVQAVGEPAPGAGAHPGGGAAGAHSDQELDALAHELYDRLRSRLRMELLVDRERAGLVTDLR
jgi:hypothetical protein